MPGLPGDFFVPWPCMAGPEPAEWASMGEKNNEKHEAFLAIFVAT